MRYREPFCVYPRTLNSGKVVYYYQTYDPEGNRTPGRSTGALKARDARVYCMKLYREGTLGLREKRIPTMAEYSVGWWDPKTCEYLRRRQARRIMSDSYARLGRGILERDILPFFGKKRVDRITTHDIDLWMVSYVERGRSGLTANRNFGILRIMLSQAVRKGLIEVNPCDEVEPVKEVHRQVRIFTPDEVRRLFSPEAADTIWGNELYRVMNMLSASTGLRIGEVLGVTGRAVREEYVEVCGQYTQYGMFTDTKTHETRNVTIPTMVAVGLSRLKEINGDGYLFSTCTGEKPVSRKAVEDHMRRALERIGISREEQKERNLTFHKWRYFFNTTLRMGNVADSKVRELTGHKTEKMTEHYTQFDPRKFGDVKRIQEEIILGGFERDEERAKAGER